MLPLDLFNTIGRKTFVAANSARRKIVNLRFPDILSSNIAEMERDEMFLARRTTPEMGQAYACTSRKPASGTTANSTTTPRHPDFDPDLEPAGEALRARSRGVLACTHLI